MPKPLHDDNNNHNNNDLHLLTTLTDAKFVYREAKTDKPTETKNVSRHLDFKVPQSLKRTNSVRKTLMPEEPSFKPQINKISEKLGSKKESEPLFKDMREIWNKRQEQKKEIEEKDFETNVRP